MSKNFNELPIELIKQIDKTVEEAINKKFLIDPLLGKKRSLEQSIHGSLVKRHGLIIQNAIETAFKQSSHHTVIDSKGFKISSAAERLTEYKPHDLGRLPDLVHFPGNGRITYRTLLLLTIERVPQLRSKRKELTAHQTLARNLKSSEIFSALE